MTASLSPLPPPRRPARSGEPWSEADYETLVRLCLEGTDLAAVAEVLQRRDTAVLNRARRMLPLDERGLPADRALTQLRTHLRDDPEYDWAARLTESPPPRPVGRPIVTEQLNGIPGLADDALLDLAGLVVHSPSTDVPTYRKVLAAVSRRGLAVALAERIGEHLVDEAMQGAGLGAPVWSARNRYGSCEPGRGGPAWDGYPDREPCDGFWDPEPWGGVPVAERWDAPAAPPWDAG